MAALPVLKPLFVASLLLGASNEAISLNHHLHSFIGRIPGRPCVGQLTIQHRAAGRSNIFLGGPWNACLPRSPRKVPLSSHTWSRDIHKDEKFHDRTKSFVLLSAASSSPSPEDEARQPTPITSNLASQVDPKSQLSFLYTVGQVVFGITSLVLLLMPDRTMTTLLAAKWGGAAGYGIAAGLCFILKGANDHDRLSSDTYKRLSVGLLGFNLIGLSAIPGEAAFLPKALPAMLLTAAMTCLRMFGCVLAFRGWKRGSAPAVDGSTTWKVQDVLNELASGTKETIRGLRVKSNKKALTYRNCLLLVCFGIFSSFMEGLFNIEFRERFLRTWFEISLQWSAVGRLFMIATMIYSLKDAAERDRLTGTTFIQLNIMVGAWSALVGLGQSIYPLGFAAYRGVEMYAFSLPFFTKALKSQKEKDTKARNNLSG